MKTTTLTIEAEYTTSTRYEVNDVVCDFYGDRPYGFSVHHFEGSIRAGGQKVKTLAMAIYLELYDMANCNGCGDYDSVRFTVDGNTYIVTGLDTPWPECGLAVAREMLAA